MVYFVFISTIKFLLSITAVPMIVSVAIFGATPKTVLVTGPSIWAMDVQIHRQKLSRCLRLWKTVKIVGPSLARLWIKPFFVIRWDTPNTKDYCHRSAIFGYGRYCWHKPVVFRHKILCFLELVNFVSEKARYNSAYEFGVLFSWDPFALRCLSKRDILTTFRFLLKEVLGYVSKKALDLVCTRTDLVRMFRPPVK